MCPWDKTLLPTTDADQTDDIEGRPLVRLAALAIGGVEVIVFTLGAQLALLSSNASGEAHDFDVGSALAMLLPLVGLTLPGLTLAWIDRAHMWALFLVVAAVPVFAAGWAAWG